MKTPCAAALLLSVAAVLLPSHDAFKLPVGARLIRGPSSSPMTSARRTPSTTTLPSFFPKTKALQASDAAVVEGDNSGAGQVWIEPAFHNKLSVRILAVLAGVGFAMKQTGVVVPKLAATYVHLMMYGAGFGSLMYTTFVLGLVMFKVCVCVCVCVCMPARESQCLYQFHLTHSTPPFFPLLIRRICRARRLGSCRARYVRVWVGGWVDCWSLASGVRRRGVIGCALNVGVHVLGRDCTVFCLFYTSLIL